MSGHFMSYHVMRWQADVVFWLGDLNYRIAEDVPDEVVFEMLKSDNLEFLRRVGHVSHGSHVFAVVTLVIPLPAYRYGRAAVRVLHAFASLSSSQRISPASTERQQDSKQIANSQMHVQTRPHVP